MSVDPLNPVIGQLIFDGSEFLPYIVDLAPGDCVGLVPTREGFDLVCQELLTNQATYGALAGIADQEITDLTTANTRIARIDAFIPAIRKALELLIETRCKIDDQRQRIALDAAKAVDRRAARSPELLAKYQKTREYRSEIAKKAVKTREKKGKPVVTAAKQKASPPETPAQPGSHSPG